MKYTSIIPARGGSKGIPQKNIRLVSGGPLIEYSLDVAVKIEGLTSIWEISDEKIILLSLDEIKELKSVNQIDLSNV